jgi:hypothetical protein
MEIDENLARSELTSAEESTYIWRHKVIGEEPNSGKILPLFLRVEARITRSQRKLEKHR